MEKENKKQEYKQQDEVVYPETQRMNLELSSIIVKIKRFVDFYDKIIKLFLDFVPKWFKFVSWLIILGALLYVYLKYKSEIFGFLYFISLFFLLYFLIFSIRRKLSLLKKHIKNTPLIDFLDSIFFTILTISCFIFLVYISLGLSLP